MSPDDWDDWMRGPGPGRPLVPLKGVEDDLGRHIFRETVKEDGYSVSCENYVEHKVSAERIDSGDYCKQELEDPNRIRRTLDADAKPADQFFAQGTNVRLVGQNVADGRTECSLEIQYADGAAEILFKYKWKGSAQEHKVQSKDFKYLFFSPSLIAKVKPLSKLKEFVIVRNRYGNIVGYESNEFGSDQLGNCKLINQ